MSIEVTVLGSCGAYPRPGRACSGYLLQYEESNIVLDLGAGALSNLLKHVGHDRVDGLALSHLHYDHYVDVYGLYTARRFSPYRLAPLPVLCPSGASEVAGSPLSGESRRDFFKQMRFTHAEEGVSVGFAGFEVTAQAALHPVTALAFRVEAGGRSVCYTGDTDLSDSLVELARGCDLFICEATFTSEIRQKAPGHLFAAEAGRLASEAGAGALLLTHVWPTLSEERAVEDAAGEFDGPVRAAAEDLTMGI